MALLAVQDASEGLANVVRSAATGGGDTVPPGARAGGWGTGVFLLVQNTDVAAKTVTVEGLAPIVVPANTGLAVIPIWGVYERPRTVAYSAVTGVTVAAVRLHGD